jgi:hypothetical protein
LSQTAGVFSDPNSPALRHAPIEQFWREQLLVTAMLERGHYQDGRFVVIAPALNAECQAAITRFRTELISDDPTETRFQAITLEDLTIAIGDAGAETIAARNRTLPRLHAGASRFSRDLQHATRRELTVAKTTLPLNQRTQGPLNKRASGAPLCPATIYHHRAAAASSGSSSFFPAPQSSGGNTTSPNTVTYGRAHTA